MATPCIACAPRSPRQRPRCHQPTSTPPCTTPRPATGASARIRKRRPPRSARMTARSPPACSRPPARSRSRRARCCWSGSTCRTRRLAPHRPVRHGFAAALALVPGTALEISQGGMADTLPWGEFQGNAAAACPLLAARSPRRSVHPPAIRRTRAASPQAGVELDRAAIARLVPHHGAMCLLEEVLEVTRTRSPAAPRAIAIRPIRYARRPDCPPSWAWICRAGGRRLAGQSSNNLRMQEEAISPPYAM